MPQDLVITPNRGSTTSGAQIAFTGYSGASSIYLKVLPDSSLSFEGSAGQLFSITDNLSSGTIFSVNDITGIPSFDVNANGLVRIAPFAGNVALGTTATSGRLQINTGSATTIGQIIQGASGQSSNYLQTVNVSGLVGATIDSSMNFTRPVSGYAYSEQFGSSANAAGYAGTAIGNQASAAQTGATAVGQSASAGNQYATIVGFQASTSSVGAVGIGWGANPGQNGVAIGRSVGSSAGGIAIGYGVSTSAYGDIVFNAAGDGTAGPTNFQIYAGTATANSFYKQHSIYGTWISNVVATRQARVQKYVADFGGDREALRYESNLSYALTSIGGSAVLSGQSLAVTAPAASYTPLTLKGATSQTANLQAWQNSAGSTIASMNASGAILANYGGFGGAIPSGTFKLDVTGLANIGGTTFDGNGGASFPSTSAGGYNTSVTVNNTTKGYGVYVSKNQGGDVDSSISAFYATVTNTYANNPACYIGVSNSPGCKIFIARGSASQTANLSEWQNSAGTVIASINASGAFNGLLASGVVTSGEIGNAAVVSGNIASGAVGAYHFNATGLASGRSLSTDGTGVLSWATGGGGGLTISDDTSTNATRYLAFTSATTGSISTANVSSTKLTFNPSTGDFTAGGNITANSDIKIKTNIKTIENALDKVKSLRGVSFTRIGTDIKNVGVIAQEVEAVVPELVRESDGLKSVAYGNITALLIEAIKEQSKKIEELENKLCQLTSSQS
jgi:hypothetical protein